jgi:hypothetical protein
MWGTGRWGIFSSTTGKRLTQGHFEKIIDKWTVKHPEDVNASCPAAGVPSINVNRTDGEKVFIRPPLTRFCDLNMCYSLPAILNADINVQR